MPTIKKFRESVFDVTLDYGFGKDNPKVTVAPFADVESFTRQLAEITDDDEGRRILYGLICERLESWKNVRDEIPGSVERLEDVPRSYRHLYKQCDVYAEGELPDPLYYLDGNSAASPREVEIPLTVDDLMDFRMDFAIALDIVKRAVQEVDTKKRHGARV